MILPKHQISILAGCSGAGKSTLLLQALRQWEHGEPFPIQWEGEKVAFLVADRTKEELVKKAEKIGLERVQFYGLVDDKDFKTEWLDDPSLTLTKALANFKEAYDVLIIDPVMLFIGKNANDYVSVAKGLINLNRLAISRNLTIIATHHAAKPRSDFFFKRPQDRILGSAALQGFSGTQMVLIQGKEQDMGYDSLFLISHTEPEEQAHFIRDDAGWFVLSSPEKQPELKDILTPGVTLSANDIVEFANGLGMPLATLYRKLKELQQTGVLSRVGKGMYKVNC